MAGDSPDETRPGDPAEFLSKPKWQRFLILLAGPGMNLLIAIAVIAGISMHGTEETVIRPVIGEAIAGKPAEKAGLKYGDVITAINGEPIADYEDLRLAITLHANTPLRVDFLRNGVKQTTVMTPAREETEYGPTGKAGIDLKQQAVLFRAGHHSDQLELELAHVLDIRAEPSAEPDLAV